MVKTVLGVSHSGLRDWLVQRLSAVVVALYTLGLAYFFVTNPHLSFSQWQALFANIGMKIATIAFILAIALHAWVGIWTVITDYGRPAALRFIIEVLVFFTLFACSLWGLMIVWGV